VCAEYVSLFFLIASAGGFFSFFHSFNLVLSVILKYLMKKNTLLLPYLALAAGIICIGFSAIFVKLADVPGSVSAFYRSAIAASVIIPWWLRTKHPYPDKRTLNFILLAGVFFGIDIVMWNSGIMLTSAATATLLANNAPVWVGLGSFFLFGEKLSYKYWIGLLTAMTGMILLVGLDAVRNLQFNMGDLLSIAASVFYAGYILITQRIRQKIDTLTFTAFFMTSCTAVTFLFNLALGNPFWGFSVNTWLNLAALGLITHLGGWLTINYALGHLKAAQASVSLLAQAVVTAIVAIPILNEYLSFNQIIGGAFVLAGVYFVNIRFIKKTKALKV
jgi:drug/metabolite transporter (DMT)-like permease